MTIDQIQRAIPRDDPSPADRIGRGIGRTGQAASAPLRRVAAATSELLRSIAAMALSLVRSTLRFTGRLVSRIGDLVVRLGTPATAPPAAAPVDLGAQGDPEAATRDDTP